MLNNFVNFELLFTKLSGIDSFEKRIIYTRWAWLATFFMACSKLEAMAIYVVKSANAKDIMLSV